MTKPTRRSGSQFIERTTSRRKLLLGSAGLLLGTSHLSCLSYSGREGLEDYSRLLPRFDGDLVFPHSEGYERARMVASRNERFNRRPLVVAYCSTEADIQRCLEVASDRDLPLAVRCGGHDVLGASTCDDGVLLDVSRIDSMTLDDSGQVLSVGGGVRAGAVNTYLSERGRVAALGCNPAVGVSGLTLGGGLGWFLGRHGATCDSVVGARVVTPDGVIRVANTGHNGDLFWAIRGGGGNFGIVSQWQLDTFEQPPVTAGTIVYDGERLEDFLEFYREQHHPPKEDLTVEVVGLGHTRHVVAAAFVFAGDQKNVDAVLAPWLRFGPPLAVDIATAPLGEHTHVGGEAQSFFEWPGDPQSGEARPGSYWQGVALEKLDDRAIDVIVTATKDPPFGWSWGLGHFLSGKAANPEDSTPFVRHAGSLTVHFDGGWEQATRAEPLMKWIDSGVAALDALAGNVDYLNYLSSDAPKRVRATFGPNFPRLLEIKRRFDPDNLLRRNRNIKPS